VLRLQPKAKERRKIAIPADLRDAMKEVLWLVKQAKRDPDVVIDFDDAIQVGPICGGRYQKKPSRFEFRYRPENGGVWYLDFHTCDIEDIADERLAEITMYCCASPGCGMKFNKAYAHCECDYVKDPDFGTFEFPEAAEKLQQRGVVGISQASTRNDVLAALGPPDKVVGNVKSSLGYVWPWITYRRDDCQLRFEFGKKRRIRNITILERDWEPGK